MEYLCRKCPQCRYKNRWVFVYASYAMGVSHSVADFQEIMSAVVDACRASGVGDAFGKQIKQWKGQLYIDDVDAAATGSDTPGLDNGSGFGACLQLGLQIFAILTWLGCDINVEKSGLLPRQKDGVFLGIGHDTKRMRFFLSKRRCAKLRAKVEELMRFVRVGARVPAKLVAQLVGTLWSIEVVCHRAVAIMCRGMIACLAKMLGSPELKNALKFNLRWLLKRAWKGDVVWTDEADQELHFWATVVWEELWSPMGYDVLLAGLSDAVREARPKEWAPNVMVIAADTSNRATGGGRFQPLGDGRYECKDFAYQMLRGDIREESSTLRELEGICATLMAEAPSRGSRVIVVTDNQGVWRILTKGSSDSRMRRIVRQIFLYCVRNALVIQSVWLSRESPLIRFCDKGSRILDTCNYSAHPGLFWGANDIARKLWGQGFSHDRFASTQQVQPVDCTWKLPFTSWYRQAFAEGTDAFRQFWGEDINWVNAPFALIGKVYALVREQHAVAAVVVPRYSKKWWAPLLTRWSEGVVHRWDLPGSDNRCQMVNGEEVPPKCRSGLAVVFLDFRRQSSTVQLRSTVTAEQLWEAWLASGGRDTRWRYYQPSGGWIESLPDQPVPAHPRF